LQSKCRSSWTPIGNITWKASAARAWASFGSRC
jgi:hypothetical protein